MKTVFKHKEIEENLEEISKDIFVHYKYNVLLKEPLLTVPILNGGLFLYVDLVRKLSPLPTELGIISTKHYGEAEVPLDEVSVRYRDIDVKDRDVLLIDEICFTGKTFKRVKDLFLEEGANSVESVTLIDHIRDNRVHEPTWSVVTYTGDKWLVGYGMDLDGLHRESLNVFYEE